MKFIVVYDKRAIMKEAHKFFRDGRMGDFGECLRKAWDNAKNIKNAVEGLGKEVKTWYGWKMVGQEVIHGQHALFQLELYDTYLKNSIRVIKSYFGREQTCKSGSQGWEYNTAEVRT